MLLIVTQLIDSNSSSTGYYWERIIKTLSKDNKILLITSERSEILESNKNIKVIQANISQHLKNHFNFGIGFLYKILISILMLHYSIKFSRKVKNILIGTNPFLISLLPIFLKFFFIKAKVNIIIFDLFPENLLHTSKNFFLRIFCNFLKIFFDISYRQFDKVFSIGRDMSKVLEEKKIKNNRIIYTPNWCDDDYDFDYSIQKNCLSALDINFKPNENIVLLFFGNLGRFQNIDLLLDIISKTKNKNLIFLFVGNGEKRNIIKEASLNDKRIYLKKGVDLSKRSNILACGDISLVTLPDEMLGFAVPSKSYFSLAYGMPLFTIMNQMSEITLLVEENNFGWCFSSEQKIEAANLLDNLSIEEIKQKKDSILRNKTKFSSFKTLNLIKNNLLNEIE